MSMLMSTKFGLFLKWVEPWDSKISKLMKKMKSGA